MLRVEQAARARVLNAMAARFEARAEHLARLLATEVGKVLPDARFETSTVLFNLRFNTALALKEFGSAAEVGEDSFSIVIRQPVGVAGIFAPWTGHFAWRARWRQGRSGSTIGPTYTTSLKKAASSKVAGVACAGKQVWMTFLNANTSPSSRGRSSVEGAHGYAGLNPSQLRHG